MSSINELEFHKPKIVLLLSGKRKSGKDYVANLLLEKFGSKNCVIIRLSAPIKKQYAIDHNLDFAELLEASEYKEIYRLKMIKWSEEIREQDNGFFCRLAIEQSSTSEKPIWIISDARRESDAKFFHSHYPSITYVAQIYASLDVRVARGFKFTEGIDDAESECGLDNYKFDFQIKNDTDAELSVFLKPVIELIMKKSNLKL